MPDLTSLVESHGVTLKRSGKELVGLCPFHAERTPSFYVHPGKGLYHCYGCGASGDAITFVRETTGSSYREALEILGGEEKARYVNTQDRSKLERMERSREELARRAAKEAADTIKICQMKEHDYVFRKSAGLAVGIRKDRVLVTPDGEMIVPMYLAGTRDLVGAQRIFWNGESWQKKYIYGTRASGAAIIVGHSGPILLCEGYATGLSILYAMRGRRVRVAVCFSASNIKTVAGMLDGKKYVCADNDKSGTGALVAQQTGLGWCMPPDVGDDFNDLHQKKGHIAIMAAINRMLKE